MSEADTIEDALYHKLWLAVILRAKEDAEGINTNHRGPGELRELKREGRQWLIGDTILRPKNKWDLEIVCEMAGVQTETVTEMAKRRYYGMSNE